MAKMNVADLVKRAKNGKTRMQLIGEEPKRGRGRPKGTSNDPQKYLPIATRQSVITDLEAIVNKHPGITKNKLANAILKYGITQIKNGEWNPFTTKEDIIE